MESVFNREEIWNCWSRCCISHQLDSLDLILPPSNHLTFISLTQLLPTFTFPIVSTFTFKLNSRSTKVQIQEDVNMLAFLPSRVRPECRLLFLLSPKEPGMGSSLEDESLLSWKFTQKSIVIPKIFPTIFIPHKTFFPPQWRTRPWLRFNDLLHFIILGYISLMYHTEFTISKVSKSITIYWSTSLLVYKELRQNIFGLVQQMDLEDGIMILSCRRWAPTTVLSCRRWAHLLGCLSPGGWGASSPSWGPTYNLCY